MTSTFSGLNEFSSGVSTNLVADVRAEFFSEEVQDANWHDRVGAHGREYGETPE
jgi:hypothetical protein